MELVEKLQPVIIIAAALFGLLLGYITPFGEISEHFVEPFLMVLLFFVFLSVEEKKFKQSFLNVKFTVTSLIINFIWTPIFAYGLGKLFFYHTVDMQIGLLMLMVTPCTDWYLVFTALAKGDVELGASILPLNLLLQILLLPLYLLIFFGGKSDITGGTVILSVLFVLIIPFALALLCKFLEKRNETLEKIVDKIRDFDEHAEIIFLCLAIISMFACESKPLFENPVMLLKMLLPMIIFFIVNFIGVRFLGQRLGFKDEEIVPLNFTTLARESTLALAIAVAVYPERPLIPLALVIGSLIELPSLGVITYIINTLRGKTGDNNKPEASEEPKETPNDSEETEEPAEQVINISSEPASIPLEPVNGQSEPKAATTEPIDGQSEPKATTPEPIDGQSELTTLDIVNVK
uniref:Bile acid:sodium symporter n=1 Tax=Piromyces sp. TaxID=45796 RepID=A0A2S1TZ37_PIRSP|nr:bile acid:sodium symporter [Piromyces sp.]